MTFAYETARKVGRIPIVRSLKRFKVFRNATKKYSKLNSSLILDSSEKDKIAAVISSRFDPDHYRGQEGAPQGSNKELLTHYVCHDFDGMLNPNSHFDSQFYLRNSPEVKDAGLHPYFHYLTWGEKEGRSANEKEEANKTAIRLIADHFDADYYRKQDGAPKGSPEELLAHFISSDHESMLNPNTDFNTQYYLAKYPDIQNTSINPYYHYLCWGETEGRSKSAADKYGLQLKQVEKTISPHLMVAFYLDQADPDRSADLNPVEHYCTSGWRQGFDPNPFFSTTDYLRLNPDVADSGQNPFFHFLSTGKFQGRPRKHSKRAAPDNHPQIVTAVTDLPRVGVVSMIKNESDIIRLFASHILKLFDEIVLIDHMSEDDSSDVIDHLAATRDNVTRYVLKERGYIQDIVSNHVIRDCKVLAAMDWIMFLDADEFLPFESNKEMRHFFAANETHSVVSFNWKTLIPSKYWDYSVDTFEDREFYVSTRKSSFTKIAFQPKKFHGERYWINQGNHSISRRKGMDPLPARDTNAVVFHLPIRSPNQLAIKLNQGVLSYMRRGTSENSLEGEHWFKILEKLKDSGVIKPEVLNGVAYAYGEPDAKGQSFSFEALAEAGYQLQPVDIAVSGSVCKDVPSSDTSLPQLMLKLGGSFVAERGNCADDNVVSSLKTQSDGSLVAASPRNSFVYKKLPARSAAEKSSLGAQFATDADAIFTMMKDTYQEINNLTPTSWGGHIPFMFALSSVIQPRRFVELGSHHGASFLAYCQAAKRVGSDTEAIAIDTWEGDSQAGFYDNKVFEDFKYLIRPYEKFSTYIRGYFEDAVREFEDGSIDLLHIDGLHTYAAVKLDFDTWISKMSKDGLIIFHDINVHERDFGVWQLWQELTVNYPFAQFMHSHGLGILYVGTEKKSGVRAMVDSMSVPSTMRILQVHFENVSQRLAGLAMLTWTNEQKEEQLQNHALQIERLTQLEHRNGYLETENTSIRTKLNEEIRMESSA